MKIICPYCHEENEIDISVGDSFLCKDCKKEIKIVKTGKYTKSSWIIVSILLVLVV